MATAKPKSKINRPIAVKANSSRGASPRAIRRYHELVDIGIAGALTEDESAELAELRQRFYDIEAKSEKVTLPLRTFAEARDRIREVLKAHGIEVQTSNHTQTDTASDEGQKL